MKKLSLLCLSVCACGLADGFVVPSGTTVTNPQPIVGVGDIGLIEEGGGIATTNASVSVLMVNTDQSVINFGTISNIVNGDSPVNSSTNVIGGTNGIIINYGTFSVFNQKDGALGFNVSSQNPNMTLTNYGIFSVLGTGINATASNVQNLSNNAIITNYGTFSALARGAGAFATNVQDLSINAIVTNYGTFSALATEATGRAYNVTNVNPNFTFKNYGTLSSSYIGINILGNNALIVNGGVIHGDVTALNFQNTGASSTLSLLLGSNIQGPVHVQASPLNLSVQTGLNLALTLDETSTAFGALNIRAPFVLQTDPVVAVIDPTGLAMQSDITADISDSILAGIYDHRPCFECGAWTEAVASYRTRNAQSQTLQYNDWVAGFLTGYDGFYNGHALSIFAGALYTEALIESSYQNANIVSSCAGLMYEGCVYQTLVGLSAFGAYVNWDNARDVMNNLAPGGIDAANVGIHGGMFGADMTLRRALCSAYYRPTLGFNLRYAELFLGTYTETGSLTNLKVNHRNVGLITTRLEAAFSGFRSFIEPFIGVFGRYQVVGRNVSATLLGQTIDFQQGGPLNLVAGLIGARSYQAFGNTNTFFDVEASFDNAGSTRILGEVGLVY